MQIFCKNAKSKCVPKPQKRILCELDEHLQEFCFVKAFVKSAISHFIRHCERDKNVKLFCFCEQATK